MTPKEEADELVKEMYKVHSNSASLITLYFAKQCALIAVDKILNSFYNVFDDSVVESSKVGGYRNMKDYWREVETEILNMKGGEQ
jgi:hypothetical protein